MDTNEDDRRRREYEQPLLLHAQEQWGQARRTNPIERARVRMLPQEMDEREVETLAQDEVILKGRYRIMDLLYKRPRLRLYLGCRLASEAPDEAEPANVESLVAIRELVLTGLPESLRERIERAAFEEFVAPVVLGPTRLATIGDRVWTEGERHYLVMQLHDRKNVPFTDVTTLDKLLLKQREWPTWLDEEIALSWGTRLCRIVARLHRLGVVLGDLDLSTILVGNARASSWSPILLPSWPPPPHFWKAPPSDVSQIMRQIFPDAHIVRCNPFIAPEALTGAGDERSDVYSLGAILYLLLTHYAPIAAIYRLQSMAETLLVEERREHDEQGVIAYQEIGDTTDCLELIAPRLLYHHIPALLEQILLRALELDPARRFPSVFALVEALEAAELETVMDEKAHLRGSVRRKKLKRRVRR